MIKHLQRVSALALVGFAFLANTEANAQVQYVPFSTTGSLTTQTGWANNTGTAGQLTVVEGNLSYNNLPTPEGNKVALKATDGEDAKLTLTNPITSGAIYASFLIKPESGFLDNSTIGNYFFHFIGADNNAFVSRVSIRSGSTANTFNIGVYRVSSPSPTVPTVTEVYGAAPVDHATGQTYLVVAKYDIASQTSSIWINPAPGSTESAPLHTSTYGTSNLPTAGFNAIGVRQSNSSSLGTGNMDLDEIRVGATWEAVTPSATTTGIADATKGMFSIYPNPMQNQNVRLSLPGHVGSQKVNLTVWSVEGKALVQASGSQAQVQATLNEKMAGLPKGMFFVNVTTGSEIYQTKLLKN